MQKKFQKTLDTTDEKQIAAILPWAIKLVKQGDPTAETLRCVFRLENDPCIYLYHILDFIDFRPEKKIVFFSLYQMVD